MIISTDLYCAGGGTLAQRGCGASSFRSHLNMGLSTPLFVALLEQGLGQRDPEVAANPYHSQILWNTMRNCDFYDLKVFKTPTLHDTRRHERSMLFWGVRALLETGQNTFQHLKWHWSIHVQLNWDFICSKARLLVSQVSRATHTISRVNTSVKYREIFVQFSCWQTESN